MLCKKKKKLCNKSVC
uniref:Uncharacterized protein n=1 Tax=Anguilla anguilla TaxID=7936 RepID=A0A0E9XT50_ANGAN